MKPGSDCLSCHDGGRAKRWSVAGTWTRGATIAVVDANGRSLTMKGNQVGNFYTAETLAFPLRSVTVDGTAMPAAASSCANAFSYGGCNRCHVGGGPLSVGPLMMPGADCLACHANGGSACAKFLAAGTFTDVAVGTQVDVAGLTTVTNAVGNFFLPVPASAPALPMSASVGGRTMEGGTRYGGCNACHHGRVGGADGGGD
jgi:hypothetical protein